MILYIYIHTYIHTYRADGLFFFLAIIGKRKKNSGYKLINKVRGDVCQTLFVYWCCDIFPPQDNNNNNNHHSNQDKKENIASAVKKIHHELLLQ